MPSKNCPAEIMPLKGVTMLLMYLLLLCHYLFLSNNDNNLIVSLQNYRPNCGFGLWLIYLDESYAILSSCCKMRNRLFTIIISDLLAFESLG
jgi:hypothetical protein